MRSRSIIRKRWQIWLLPLLLAALLAAFLLLPRRQSFHAGARAEAAAMGLNEYAYALVFRPEAREMDVELTLRYTNDTGDTLNDLVLRTWTGAYAAVETSPAAIDEVSSQCYPIGFDPGGLQLDGVWWNDTSVPAAYDDEAQTVLRVQIPPCSPQESGTLRLHCTLLVPRCAHRFGVSEGIWQFGNALPVLSIYENGAWRTDSYWPIGDPFVSACANYRVTLRTPLGYKCAAGGICMQETDGGELVFHVTLPAARDFAFALSDRWQEATANAGGVSVAAYAADRDDARRAAKNAAKALQTYAGLYGEYPYAALTLCAVDFPFGGMEYPCLLFLGKDYFARDLSDTLELLIAHETAHQWFYALVGSDQVKQPWQDEALCEYAMLRYVRAVYGQSAYENLLVTRVNAPMQEHIAQAVTPGSPITYFGALDVYNSVVYGRGAAYLLALDAFTGRLDAFLHAYCDRFAFALATRDDFEDFLYAYTGEDLRPLTLDYLDTLMSN